MWNFWESDMSVKVLVFLMLLTAAISASSQVTRMVDDKGDDRMQWWRKARFGMFIHWGLYAIPAGKWKDSSNHGEWIMETAQIPIREYEQYVQQFNPVRFDAAQWASLAKEAGMKYVVITSKHHDGFALFDSKVSDYDIMATPWKRDVMRELSDAVRKEGLAMCWYHSIMDWHHPDYIPHRAWGAPQPKDTNFDRFVRYLHDQVTELLTNYGPIGVMWFDGEWESTWNHKLGQELYDLCRRLQPNVIVNNRVDVGRGGMAGMSDKGYAGDFGTPEQEIPATGLPGVDWETCMTMNNHWGYNAFDKQFKTSTDLIQKLCDIASKGGNFLLNVGPKADGTIPEESIKILKEIGEWMRANGESIYATRASPFKDLPWGRCTMKSAEKKTTLYLQVFDWPKDGSLVVPGLGNAVRNARIVGQKLHLPAQRSGANIVISVPKAPSHSACSVIALEVEGAPIVYNAPQIESAADILVDEMAVKLHSGHPELQVHFTLDGSAPTIQSPRYRGPIVLKTTQTVSAAAAHGGKIVSNVTRREFRKVTPLAPVNVGHPLRSGLWKEIVSGSFDSCEQLLAQKPTGRETVTNVSLGTHEKEEQIGLRFVGWIDVPRSGVYVFSLTSDDGSMCWIGDQLVVNNDGLHSPANKIGTIALSIGKHPIKVAWFNKTGGTALDLQWALAGKPFAAIPELQFFRKEKL